MKVYIVTKSCGTYSAYTEKVLAVVSTLEKAKELAMNVKPDIYYDLTITAECFEIDNTDKENDRFSEAERQAYKIDKYNFYSERIILNEIPFDDENGEDDW